MHYKKERERRDPVLSIRKNRIQAQMHLNETKWIHYNAKFTRNISVTRTHAQNNTVTNSIKWKL